VSSARRGLARVVAMTASEEYCDFCDLPLAQCIHGQPPEPKPPVKAAPKPTKRAVARSRPAGPVEKAVNRRWTPPEVLKPLVLEVLQRCGGELEADELLLELEIAAADRLRPEDHELTPAGEPRWQYAARRARMALIDEGLMTRDRPGLWKLAGTR
jgi:hypothetical protein